MNNIELAEIIRKKFIPFAFLCECAGKDPECAKVFESPAEWRQHDTALRIAYFIEKLEQ